MGMVFDKEKIPPCIDCKGPAKGMSIWIKGDTYCMRCFYKRHPELDPAMRDEIDTKHQKTGDEPV